MSVTRSEAPGPLVAPWDVEVGKEYFFRNTIYSPFTKGKVTNFALRQDGINTDGWRNRVIYKISVEGQPDFIMIWNPESHTPETHLSRIHKIINPILERRKHLLANRTGGRRGRRSRTRRRKSTLK